MAFTYFFRDMQTMEIIRDYALPQLRCRRYIRIWDAGCAMGPEPYSLAMVLRENMGHMYFRNVKITATDIDGSNLFEKIIREGVYPREQVERIPTEILARYFTADSDGENYQLSEEIRRCLCFKKHDLLSLAPVGKDFGLILCKNVLLHFTQRERVDVIRLFYDSLTEGGYFATEQTQKLPEECRELFEPVVSNAQLFRKR